MKNILKIIEIILTFLSQLVPLIELFSKEEESKRDIEQAIANVNSAKSKLKESC